MTIRKNLSDRLRDYVALNAAESGADILLVEAADALDRQAAEIALLKEGRQLHDEWADHLEHRAKEQP